MKRFIYADNAATTRLDADAFEAMKPFLLEDYGNASQPYALARRPKKAILEARETIAGCIGALPDEIFFTSGGTESDNWALKCSGLSGGGRKVFTSAIEHHAVLNACRNAARLPVDTKGILLPAVLEEALSAEGSPTLVSVMLANNEIGTIEPIKELATVAHARGALFHTDAVQAVGHIPVDVSGLGVDMLSASAHKFNGPKGTGFLYVRRGTLLVPYADGGVQERGMRAGTENVAGIVGMATALKKNCSGIYQTAERLRAMEANFIDALRRGGVDFIRNGAEKRLPGNINISIRGASGEALLHRLDLKGISISTGSACDSVSTHLSHVIRAIGVPLEYAEGTIRISFGRDNKPEDAVEVAAAVADALRRCPTLDISPAVC